MVYAMICYNISMNIGGMTNQVFLMAFHEMIIMWPAAFILEFFLVDHLAHKLAFCMVTPQDRPIVITLAISITIIAIMCPIMSFIATLLFKNAGKEFVAVWLQTTFLNFPVAFFWQLYLLRTLHPFSVPQTVSGKIRKDIHKGNRFSPLSLSTISVDRRCKMVRLLWISFVFFRDYSCGTGLDTLTT